MPELLGRGYCGGHVTLMFTIEDSDPDPVNQGSRGVGICLEDGVEIICRGRGGRGNLDVFFTDHIGDSRLYMDSLSLLSDGVPEVMEYDWEATVKLGLPTGQGFGMSAAGSVSFCNSIQRAIGIPYEEGHRRSLMIAHLVDRRTLSFPMNSWPILRPKGTAVSAESLERNPSGRFESANSPRPGQWKSWPDNR